MSHEYVAEEFELRGYTVKVIQDQHAENPRNDDNAGTMVCWHSRYNLGDKPYRRASEDGPEDFMLSLAEEFRPGLGDWLDNDLHRRMVTSPYPNNCNDPDGRNERLYVMQRKQWLFRRQQVISNVLEKHYVILPLYLMDHSGISISTGSFNDPWDSGQVGWIYITKKDAMSEWAGRWHNGKCVSVAKKFTKAVRARTIKYLQQEVETYDQYLTGQVYGYVIEDSDGDDVDSCWGFFGLDYAISEAKSAVPETPCMMGGEGADNAMEATLA